MALARLDIPSLMLYGGSIAPGRWQRQGRDDRRRLRGDRRPRRRRHDRRGAARTSRTTPAPAPAPAAASSPPTRWPARSRRMGISPGGSSMVPAEDATKEQVAEQIGRLVMKVLERRPAPEPRDHPQLDRERDRLRRRVGRLDQRRPAPARGRPRDGDRARHRRLRGDLLAHPAARPTSSRAGASSPPTSTEPAACR